MGSEKTMETYNPERIESRWYSFWEDHQLFRADPRNPAPAYSIVIPPPNVTGSLHMGHALNNTLQDILIRFKRQKGFSCLWMPGTDHAGIATQYVVEKKLKSENKSKEELGREKFLEKVWEWKAEHGGKIIHQLKKLGCSCDWERERFTMDEGLSRAVREVFVRLYEEGLIYQSDYIISWCPSCYTALSDLEVEHQEEKGKLWHVEYPLKDGSSSLIVATTRPETMFGDTAVAVNPEDERYQGYIGKEVILPLKNKPIPVIGDSYVDMTFGTGALKITPAHDPNDYEIGLRHDLPAVKCIDDRGIMTEEAVKYVGMNIRDCRGAVVKDLEEAGLLVKEEDYVHQVGQCYRCRQTVEPNLSKQWFVKIKPLAEQAIKAVEDDGTKFVPKSWEKTYFEWMNNIRDWCISRQLWWGHRIPVWTCVCGEVIVSRQDPDQCPVCGSSQLTQDPDVLDTWFSSALWPFSTMGWPDETDLLRKYYPTSVLVTAFDIIFFWVARMMMMGLKFMDDVPFKDVYIHALVLDAKGEKMSKTKGNVIDPLVIIDKFGADAFRFTLAALAAQGRNVRLSEDRIEGYRHFANKIWNAVRFTLMKVEPGEDAFIKPEPFTLGLADRWILSKLQKISDSVSRALDEYRFNEAAHLIYHFTWHEFCDWYIELQKPVLDGERGEAAQAAGRYVLVTVLQDILKLLHSFMPFVTEELYHILRGQSDPAATESIMLKPFPKYDPDLADEASEADMELIMRVITAIRNLRSEVKMEPKAAAHVAICLENSNLKELLHMAHDDIALLTRAGLIEFHESGHSFTKSIGMVVSGGVEVYLLLEEIPELSAEIARLKKAIEKMEKEIKQSRGKLENEKFTQNAPEEVVEKEKEKLEENLAGREKLLANLQRIESLMKGEG